MLEGVFRKKGELFFCSHGLGATSLSLSMDLTVSD